MGSGNGELAVVESFGAFDRDPVNKVRVFKSVDVAAGPLDAQSEQVGESAGVAAGGTDFGQNPIFSESLGGDTGLLPSHLARRTRTGSASRMTRSSEVVMRPSLMSVSRRFRTCKFVSAWKATIATARAIASGERCTT